MHNVPAGRKNVVRRYGLRSKYHEQAYRPELSFTVRSVKGANILTGLSHFPGFGTHRPTIPASPSFGFPFYEYEWSHREYDAYRNRQETHNHSPTTVLICSWDFGHMSVDYTVLTFSLYLFTTWSVFLSDFIRNAYSRCESSKTQQYPQSIEVTTTTSSLHYSA